MTSPFSTKIPNPAAGNPHWLAPGSLTTALLSQEMPSQAHVVEAFIAAKGPNHSCEDRLVVGPHHVAVLDGMSSPLRAPGEQGSGERFSQQAAEAILKLPEGISARDAIDQISVALTGITSGHAGPSGVVAAIYSVARREVWRVGDIHISIEGEELLAGKLVDTAMSMFRAAVNAAHMAGGVPQTDLFNADLGLEAAAPLLRVQQALANTSGPFGYGVFNGTHVPDEFLEIRSVALGAEVILASDGFLSPAPSLTQAQHELDLAIAADPACVIELRDMGKALQSGMDAPDDRSYVRLAA